MRYINSNWSAPIVLIVLLAAINFSQTVPDIPELQMGKAVQRELAGGETHLYSIRINAGHFLSLIVDQRGIDVIVTLSNSDGNQLMEVDSPNGTKGIGERDVTPALPIPSDHAGLFTSLKLQ